MKRARLAELFHYAANIGRCEEFLEAANEDVGPKSKELIRARKDEWENILNGALLTETEE